MAFCSMAFLAAHTGAGDSRSSLPSDFGDLDPGRFTIRTFYERCRLIGYSIMLKVPKWLGHSENGEIIKLRKVFFDDAPDVKKRVEKESVTRHP